MAIGLHITLLGEGGLILLRSGTRAEIQAPSLEQGSILLFQP